MLYRCKFRICYAIFNFKIVFALFFAICICIYTFNVLWWPMMIMIIIMLIVKAIATMNAMMCAEGLFLLLYNDGRRNPQLLPHNLKNVRTICTYIMRIQYITPESLVMNVIHDRLRGLWRIHYYIEYDKPDIKEHFLLLQNKRRNTFWNLIKYETCNRDRHTVDQQPCFLRYTT